MGKLTLPKCPYCKVEFKNDMWDTTLSELACNGSIKERVVNCPYCNAKYRVTVHITYYGSKIK